MTVSSCFAAVFSSSKLANKAEIPAQLKTKIGNILAKAAAPPSLNQRLAIFSLRLQHA
jgi:hypothetical protein